MQIILCCVKEFSFVRMREVCLYALKMNFVKVDHCTASNILICADKRLNIFSQKNSPVMLNRTIWEWVWSQNKVFLQKSGPLTIWFWADSPPIMANGLIQVYFAALHHRSALHDGPYFTTLLKKTPNICEYFFSTYSFAYITTNFGEKIETNRLRRFFKIYLISLKCT